MDLEDSQRYYRALLLRQAMQSVEWTAMLHLQGLTKAWLSQAQFRHAWQACTKYLPATTEHAVS